jgi:hypothetical protein
MMGHPLNDSNRAGTNIRMDDLRIPVQQPGQFAPRSQLASLRQVDIAACGLL